MAAHTLRQAAVGDSRLGDRDRIILQVVVDLHTAHTIALHLRFVHGLLEIGIKVQHLFTHTQGIKRKRITRTHKEVSQSVIPVLLPASRQKGKHPPLSSSHQTKQSRQTVPCRPVRRKRECTRVAWWCRDRHRSAWGPLRRPPCSASTHPSPSPMFTVSNSLEQPTCHYHHGTDTSQRASVPAGARWPRPATHRRWGPSE